MKYGDELISCACCRRRDPKKCLQLGAGRLIFPLSIFSKSSQGESRCAQMKRSHPHSRKRWKNIYCVTRAASNRKWYFKRWMDKFDPDASLNLSIWRNFDDDRRPILSSTPPEKTAIGLIDFPMFFWPQKEARKISFWPRSVIQSLHWKKSIAKFFFFRLLFFFFSILWGRREKSLSGRTSPFVIDGSETRNSI